MLSQRIPVVNCLFTEQGWPVMQADVAGWFVSTTSISSAFLLNALWSCLQTWMIRCRKDTSLQSTLQTLTSHRSFWRTYNPLETQPTNMGLKANCQLDRQRPSKTGWVLCRRHSEGFAVSNAAWDGTWRRCKYGHTGRFRRVLSSRCKWCTLWMSPFKFWMVLLN